MSGEILYAVISFVHILIYFLEYINYNFLKVLNCSYLDHVISIFQFFWPSYLWNDRALHTFSNFVLYARRFDKRPAKAPDDVIFPLSCVRHQARDCSSAESGLWYNFGKSFVKTQSTSSLLLFLGCNSRGISITVWQVFVSLLNPKTLQEIQSDLQRFST